MSPEQADGREVDARSDLFSLGVVLYEMATGQRPFRGETSLSILSSILKDTPRSVTELNPAVPSDLGRIIRRALAKDPERRYQDAKDLRNDLEDLKAALDSGELSAARAASEPVIARKGSRMLVVAGGALLLAAAVLAFWSLRRDSVPGAGASTAAGTSLADLQITQLTTSGTAERPAISPDGRYVAYVQRDGDSYSLWLRQTTTTSTVQVVPSQPGVTLLAIDLHARRHLDRFRPPGRAAHRPMCGACPFSAARHRPLVARGEPAPSRGRPTGGESRFSARGSRRRCRRSCSSRPPTEGRSASLTSDVAPEPWISLVAPWRPSFAPAWSPDGKLIAIAAVGRVVAYLVNGETRVAPRRRWCPPSRQVGLSWLNADSLVFNQPAQIGSPRPAVPVALPGRSVVAAHQ